MNIGILDFDEADIYWVGLYEEEDDLISNLLNFLETAYNDGDTTVLFKSVEEIREAECDIMISLEIYQLPKNSSYGTSYGNR